MEDEVVTLLHRVGKGETVPMLVDPHSAIEAGLAAFSVDGWLIRVFFDVSYFDYVDSAVAPDGRTMDYSEGSPTSPDDDLRQESPTYAAMVEAFENVIHRSYGPAQYPR